MRHCLLFVVIVLGVLLPKFAQAQSACEQSQLRVDFCKKNAFGYLYLSKDGDYRVLEVHTDGGWVVYQLTGGGKKFATRPGFPENVRLVLEGHKGDSQVAYKGHFDICPLEKYGSGRPTQACIGQTGYLSMQKKSSVHLPLD